MQSLEDRWTAGKRPPRKSWVTLKSLQNTITGQIPRRLPPFDQVTLVPVLRGGRAPVNAFAKEDCLPDSLRRKSE